MSKYVLGGSQTAYQPGSDNRVLLNKLGIADPEEIDEAELLLLRQLYDRVLNQQLPRGAITTGHLKTWHRQWLLPVYDWAGIERSVNMGKSGFQFASTAQIPYLLNRLDNEFLSKFTPCDALSDDALINAMAIIHVEFILVHPFREGNGRLARLLADVMAVQAGYGTLDYSSWDKNREAYFVAIRQGLDCNYQPMMKWIERAFNDSEDV
jgi:cell filamentation protein